MMSWQRTVYKIHRKMEGVGGTRDRKACPMLPFVWEKHYFKNVLCSYNLNGDLIGHPESPLAPVRSVIFLLLIPRRSRSALTIHFHCTRLPEEMVKDRNWKKVSPSSRVPAEKNNTTNF